MERYDIAIIGTGPAGLEAAITATIRNKKVLLLGNETSSSKVVKAHTIQNYLGLPEIGGDALSEAFFEHMKRLEISITVDQVNTVYAMGKYFAIQGHSADYEASAVILAVGMTNIKTLKGELENLGRGVSYCATCDAALYRGRSAVVIAYSSEDEAEAEFLAERAEHVLYLPQYEGCGKLNNAVQVIYDIRPEAINIVDGKCSLTTDKETFEADGIFILRQQVAPAQLVPGLAMDGNHVAVDRKLNTNIRGLFACGDITGTPYQYIKAAGEGNVAALSAVEYLNKLD